MTRSGLFCVFLAASLIWSIPTGPDTAGAAESSSSEALGCYCVGRVGNVDCDYEDRVDIADLQFLVDHMFLSMVRLPNPEEANCDGIPGSGVDLTDLQALVDHLYLSGSELPPCPEPFNKAPFTALSSPTAYRYINDTGAYYPSTGIYLSWEAQDMVDHPYNPPEFEFEWRLYGPYDDETYEQLIDKFAVRVFVTNEDEVYKFGQPPITVCDTIIEGSDTTIDCRDLSTFYYVCDTSYDNGVRTITCDTMLIDTLTEDNEYGYLDEMLDIEHPDFVAPGSTYNKIAAWSSDGTDHWVSDRDTRIYDVFADHPHDTTVDMNFIFWVRAADPVDPNIVDPVPPFQRVNVVDPSHDRDVAVILWRLTDPPNRAFNDTVKAFWTDAIGEWADSRGVEVAFDPVRDIFPITLYGSESLHDDFFRLVLSYKTLIIVNSSVQTYNFGNESFSPMQATYMAIHSGVNAWVAMRSSAGTYSLYSPPATYWTSGQYQYCFGVEEIRYSGWSSFALSTTQAWRIEDFVGAISVDLNQWPDLNIDPDLLYRRYDWWGPYHWHPDSLDLLGRFLMPENVDAMPLGALPDVGWCVRSTDTEAMYLYASLYGPEHFLGKEFSYNGRPVMHRLDRGFFRTAHSMFTPLAFDTASAQSLVNNVLDYLFYIDPQAATSGPVNPYNEAERGKNDD